jgi:lipopolysaccharide transport system ATP-binding protein
MSDDFVIRFEHVGKMYKVFGSKLDNLLDALNLPRLRRDDRYREFWALRDINLELRRGERVGIIGRNGAGKSTLLKLVTQNLPATEGVVEVNGEVQALLEIGGGLHPEFTGRENIRAALGYIGLSRAETEAAEREIAEFTELGRFLDQPFKTYSQGMQARLAFGIATAVQPEILIVDEILGAGDAYFFSRSVARMRELISGGATVLLVSHALEQIVRFCDETIWLDRGRIVMRGDSTEVVKAYEKFIRDQEDRRLLAQNQKARSGEFDAFARESYTDEIHVEIAGTCEVREIALLRNGAVEDRVRVGDAQDADLSQSALILLDGESWTGPLEDGGFSRKVEGGSAEALFHLWFFYPDSSYAVDVTYRGGPASVTLTRGGARIGRAQLEPTEEWLMQRVLVDAEQSAEGSSVSRWRGEGSLVIRDVLLLNADEEERASFAVDTQMRLLVRSEAHRPGTYDVIPVAVIYRADGILVSNHVGELVELEVEAGELIDFSLDFGPLNLGNGRYFFSVALYRTLSHVDPSEPYDLLDRSFEFEVVGNAPFDNGIFKHSASWSASIETRTRAAVDGS